MRIRTVKPEFWTNEDLSTVAPEVQLLAVALLNYADDEGYFQANPKLVKAACAPLRDDSVTIPVALRELSRIGYIELGTCERNHLYGRVVNFTLHQKVNKPSESKVKPLKIKWGIELEQFTDDSGSPTVSVTEAYLLERKGKEQGKERKDPESDLSGNTPLDESSAFTFAEFWTAYPPRSGVKQDRGAARAEFDRVPTARLGELKIAVHNLATRARSDPEFWPKDATHWLRRKRGNESAPWEDWIDPAPEMLAPPKPPNTPNPFADDLE